MSTKSQIRILPIEVEKKHIYECVFTLLDKKEGGDDTKHIFYLFGNYEINDENFSMMIDRELASDESRKIDNNKSVILTIYPPFTQNLDLQGIRTSPMKNIMIYILVNSQNEIYTDEEYQKSQKINLQKFQQDLYKLHKPRQKMVCKYKPEPTSLDSDSVKINYGRIPQDKSMRQKYTNWQEGVCQSQCNSEGICYTDLSKKALGLCNPMKCYNIKKSRTKKKIYSLLEKFNPTIKAFREEIVNVPGDGDCFFHSIALCIGYLVQEHPQDLNLELLKSNLKYGITHKINVVNECVKLYLNKSNQGALGMRQNYVALIQSYNIILLDDISKGQNILLKRTNKIVILLGLLIMFEYEMTKDSVLITFVKKLNSDNQEKVLELISGFIDNQSIKIKNFNNLLQTDNLKKLIDIVSEYLKYMSQNGIYGGMLDAIIMSCLYGINFNSVSFYHNSQKKFIMNVIKPIDIINVKYNVNGFLNDLVGGLHFNLNAFIYNNREHWLVMLPLDKKINPTEREIKYFDPPVTTGKRSTIGKRASAIGKRTAGNKTIGKRTIGKRSTIGKRPVKGNKNKTKTKTKGKAGVKSKKKN